MSEPMTKQRSSIDLDDFEREMRGTHHHDYNDPLAELARLVGEQPDPYGDVFAREAQAGAHPSAAERHDGQPRTRLRGGNPADAAVLR